MPTVKYLRMSELCTPKNGTSRGLLPVPAVTLRLWVRQGRFPKPVWLGPNLAAWEEAAVLKWLEERKAASA